MMDALLPRRRFLRCTGLLAAASAAGPLQAAPRARGRTGGAFELEELSLAALQDGLARREWTSRALTRLYLERIDALDRRGPGLRSVIEINPEAEAIARQRDAERKAGRVCGPLHGIPVLLKDNIDTADRMHTSAGSLALATSTPRADAPLVRRLRDAGAVLLGKANLSEWANFRSNRSSSGWSARGGQCRNPYVLDRNPCGSSSGSAVAVAANLTAVSVGTETDGSLVCPGGRCGIVALKPTVGWISRSGIIPISHTQDTAGPMTRTVADAALLLAALGGVDPADPATEDAAPRHRAFDPNRCLAHRDLRGVRLGVVRRFDVAHPEARRLWASALDTLKSLGAELIDPVELKSIDDLGDAEFTVLLYEFKSGLNRYLAGLGPEAPIKSLAELIAFNEREAAREMPFFGQETLLKAESKGPLTTPEYLEARAKAQRLSRTEGIDAAMDAHRLDALVAPTGGPAWPIDLVNGDRFTGGSSQPAAVAGYPNLTVPAGFVYGLPVGVSFFGRAWSEPVLIRCGHAYEQATRQRQPPRFLPTVTDAAG